MTSAAKNPDDEKNEGERSQGRYPRSVFFIIGNEFCERFSYYGMRTILIIYLTRVLLYTPNQGTLIFHVFSMGCYFTPILGAIIADSWLGKFNTIFYISIIYALGNVMISVGSIPHPLQSMTIISLLGLALIAIGTGGIKPCVAAFGGDQFEPGQEKYLQQFFSFFYMSINFGSMISTFLTPILRADVHCFNQVTCFPVAFGVPAVLMILSLILFLLGKPMYKMNPPKGNIIVKVGKCMGHAISRKVKGKEKKRDHWLDHADDEYTPKFINGVKTLLHILFMFLPLPLFWALFDQQGSKWTLQAEQMDNRFGGFVLQPDQMQVFNPLLILIIVPIFEYAVYPVFQKCNLFVRPLQRMAFGGVLAAVAFVLAGLIQIQIEKELPVLPSPGNSKTVIMNTSPCHLNISYEFGNTSWAIPRYGDLLLPDMPLDKMQTWEVSTDFCTDIGPVKSATYEFMPKFQVQSLMITPSEGQLNFIMVEDSMKKNVSNSKVRIFFNIQEGLVQNGTEYFELVHKNERKRFYATSPVVSQYGVTNYETLVPNKYQVYIPGSDVGENETSVGEVIIGPSGNYILNIFQNPTEKANVHINSYAIVKPNSINILFQIPQYVIITIGEVMFSITGLEFSYAQAPKTMKSVLQAAWLLTVAIGDLVVAVVAESSFFKLQSTEFFMFATVMGLDMFIFSIMAIFYQYVKPEDINDDSVDESETESNVQSNGKANVGYAEDTKL